MRVSSGIDDKYIAMRTFVTEKLHKSTHRCLAEVILQLRQIQSALTVAVAALKQQNCELDADIANVLQRSGADKLYEQAEKLEAVQQSFKPKTKRPTPL